MEKLLRFLEEYELWGYVLLGIVGLVYFQKLVQAWSEWRMAVFGLERESAQRRLSTALTIMVLLFLIGALQFSMITFVAPAYPVSEGLPTTTMNVLFTPTATLNPLIPTIAVVGTVAVSGGATPLPTVAGTPSQGCIIGQIEWTFPKPGEEVSGIVEPKGIVNLPDLGFYKYEYSAAGSGSWFPIAAGNQPKKDEPLGGAWNTAQLTPGDYLLRLVIADKQNQLKPACVIPIKITTP